MRLGTRATNCGSLFYSKEEVGKNTVVAWSPAELVKSSVSRQIENYDMNKLISMFGINDEHLQRAKSACRREKPHNYKFNVLELMACEFFDKDMIFLFLTMKDIYLEEFRYEHKFMCSKGELGGYVHYMNGPTSDFCRQSPMLAFPKLTTQSLGP